MKSELSINQHNDEIGENLLHWQRKPELRRIYADFYREIGAALDGHPEGPVLECGSGIGNLKFVLPQAITSDLFPNPWLDRQENIYALSFGPENLGAVVLFDVFHHLEYPGTAFSELSRVLRPGGRLILFEPAMGLLGRFVLGLFHHEPLALHCPIKWDAPADFDPHDVSYYAAQGNAWRLFGHPNLDLRLEPEWRLVDKKFYPALPWLLSGGFRGPRLLRGFVVPLAKYFDRALSFLPHLFASRMLIVLERKKT